MSHELYSDLGNWENNCDIDLGGKREVVGTQINKEFRFWFGKNDVARNYKCKYPAALGYVNLKLWRVF